MDRPGGSGMQYNISEKARQAAAQAACWEVETVPIPVQVDAEPEARPVAALVVAEGYVLHLDMRTDLRGEVAELAAFLEEAIVAAALGVGFFPPAVAVRHDDVADALRPLVVARGIDVQVAPTLPGLEAAAITLGEEVAGQAIWPPASSPRTWQAWRLPESVVRELFRAGAAFWRAAPWKVASYAQTPTVTTQTGNEWTVCIMGSGGERFGLLLYTDPRDFQRMNVVTDSGRAFGEFTGRALCLTFESADATPSSMTDEVRRMGWELAMPDAIPQLTTINTPGGGISEGQARDLIALLDAVPRFVRANRRALQREQRREEPCELAWRDAATGSTFEYDGMASALNAFFSTLEFGQDSEPESDWADAAEWESGDSDEPDRFPGAPPNLPPELLAAARQAFDELGPDVDRDTLLRALTGTVTSYIQSYSETPQAELGGLTPMQAERLLGADWSDAGGAVRLRRNFEFSEIESSTLLRNMRVLLAFVEQENGLPLTQKGNLNVATVRQLLKVFDMDSSMLLVRDDATRITEQDVWPLHRVRMVAMKAGLLRKVKGRIVLTKRGRMLLDVGHASELYALLFQTMFQKVNLAAYSDAAPDWAELQYQMSFTLFELSRKADGWQTADPLVYETVLRAALDEAPADHWLEMAPLLFEWRILNVLSEFGLLERRVEAERPIRKCSFRKAPLYDRFITFAV